MPWVRWMLNLKICMFELYILCPLSWFRVELNQGSRVVLKKLKCEKILYPPVKNVLTWAFSCRVERDSWQIFTWALSTYFTLNCFTIWNRLWNAVNQTDLKVIRICVIKIVSCDPRITEMHCSYQACELQRRNSDSLSCTGGVISCV